MAKIIKDLIGNIGDDQRGIGKDRRKEGLKEEEHQNPFEKEKKLKKVGQKSRTKKIRWVTYETHMLAIEKFSRQEFLRGWYCHELP